MVRKKLLQFSIHFCAIYTSLFQTKPHSSSRNLIFQIGSLINIFILTRSGTRDIPSSVYLLIFLSHPNLENFKAFRTFILSYQNVGVGFFIENHASINFLRITTERFERYDQKIFLEL